MSLQDSVKGQLNISNRPTICTAILQKHWYVLFFENNLNTFVSNRDIVIQNELNKMYI